MNRLEYRNFGDHEALVVNHSVSTGSSVGVRWYEVRNPSTTPTVFQQGTFAPDSTSRFMGSAAINRAGTIALGYSASSGTVFPSLRFTGRLASDPAGVMQAEGVLFAGPASQTDGLSRWGDYSDLTVDPADDCTFWYTNQYQAVNGSFNWHTRIGRFTVPPCDSGPPRVFSVSVTPSVFEGTTPATGTVLLTGPAPTGGATVTLASSNTALVTVPASVLVPAGSQSATFPVTSVKTGTQTNVTITATFPAGTSVTGTVTILASPIVSTLTLSPGAVVGGSPSTGTVTLSGAAPAGGALITLASSNTGVATVPASFTIPAGATTGTFTVTTLAQAVDTTVTISASFHNTTRSAVLTVNRTNTLQSLTLNPTTIEGSTTSTGTVTITDPAPAGGASVALASSNTAVATVPATVTVPAGQLSANFTVSTVQVANQTTVTITGTFPAGVSRTAVLTVLRSPVPASVTFNPSTVLGGQPSTGTVTLSRAAPTGGSIVALSSSNTAAATVPASITIPAGATSGTFIATTFAQLTDTAVVVSASLNGLTQSGTLIVAAPPGNATFDGGLRAPRCATPGSVCDTGGTLVRGRDNITNGIEPNEPNTLQGSCADGAAGFVPQRRVDRSSPDLDGRRLHVCSREGRQCRGRRLGVQLRRTCSTSSSHLTRTIRRGRSKGASPRPARRCCRR